MAVIANYFNEFFLGSSIALITSLQLIYAPGQKAQAAKECYCEYYGLLNDTKQHSADELRAKLNALNKADSAEIGMLSHAARLSALSMLGLTPDKGCTVERELSWWEKKFAYFAGEYPEYPFPK